MATKKKITKKKVAKKKTKKKSKKKVAKKKVARKSESNQITKKKKPGGRNYKPTGEGKGGKRKGSGRKKGAATEKTRAIADKLAKSDEITPLEYMLGVLRETPKKLKAKYKAGKIDTEEYIVELQAMQKRKDNAAEKAAPYIHPRLASIEAKIDNGEHERWLALINDLEDK